MTRHTFLLEGPTGTGKTTSLRSAVPHLDRLFVLSTETGFEHVFFKPISGLPIPDRKKVHWKYLPPARPSFQDLRDSAQKINSMNIGALQDLKSGINKGMYDQFLKMIDLMGNFECDCCKQKHGAPDTDWAENDLWVTDGMTGLSIMSMDLTVGAKPAKTQPEWGVAMDNLERWVNKCIFDTRCSYGLLSHVGKEKDEITGGFSITTQTLGVKLAPKIVPNFDEVILAKKLGKEFWWSTTEPNCDLKCRYLPLSDKLEADFGQLFKE